MKLRHMKRPIFLLLLLATLCGCAGTPVTIDTRPVKEATLGEPRRIKSQACGFQLFLLIPIRINDRLERAYDGLRLKAGRDYIGNVSIEEYWRYAFVGTTHCTVLEAMAYERP